MIRHLLQPFTALWRAVVAYHRSHIDADTDPDLQRLIRQQHEAERSIDYIVNVVEQRYLPRRGGGRP